MKENVGEIVIEISADTKKFYKTMDEVEQRKRELEKKAAEPHKVGDQIIVGGWNLTDEEEREYDALADKLEELYEEDLKRSRLLEEHNKLIEQQKDYEETLRDLRKEDPEAFSLAGQLEDKVKEYKEQLAMMKELDIIGPEDIEQAQQLKQEISEILTKIEQTTGVKLIVKGVNDVNEEVKKVGLNVKSVEGSLKKIGTSLKRTIKSVIRWSLAVFGIRGAYMAVRNAMNVLTQEDEKLKADIDYMKTALAYIFEPIVRKIIDWVKLIVFYIAYLIKLWTGRDIFASANKNLQKATGSAKELKNQLAGFDEMNVLGDTDASGGAGAGVSSGIFEEWENFKPPKWLETFGKAMKDFGDWIKKNWKKVINIIVAGFAILLGIKLALWISQLGGAKDALGGLGNTFKGFFDGLGKGIEAIAILGGFALVLREITGLIDTFAQSGLSLNDVIGLMATVIGSLVVLITALTIAANALQSPLAMAGLLALTASISAILLVIKATLPTILDAIGKFITEIGPTLNTILETIGTNIEKIIKALGESLPPIINSVGSLFERIFNGISKIIRTVGDVIVDIMNTAKNLITTVLDKILEFINKLGPAINNFVDNAIRAVTKLINFMISGIEYMINTLVIGAIRSFINKINDVIPGDEFDLNAPSNVYIPRFYPRLAKGGIINMPGRGVPVGRAIGGESGAEGVIPLTDSQQMALLGEAIGRYITVNATIMNTMNGRVISKELQKINAENDFAYNR